MQDLYSHFPGVEWDHLLNKQPPVPANHPDDLSRFEHVTPMSMGTTLLTKSLLFEGTHLPFAGFTCTCNISSEAREAREQPDSGVGSGGLNPGWCVSRSLADTPSSPLISKEGGDSLQQALLSAQMDLRKASTERTELQAKLKAAQQQASESWGQLEETRRTLTDTETALESERRSTA